jgi:hypothetical protein
MRRMPYIAVLTVVTAAMTAGYTALGRNRRHEPADHPLARGLLAAST